jgi:Circularly permutated YpsA SLOG family
MLQRIISGGQRGADQAALDAAIKLGFQTGGTAPRGYRVCLFDGSNSSDRELLEGYGLVGLPPN